MTVYYYTFGCKVNQYETSVIEGMMKRRGFDTSRTIAQADICIINSCTVTASADTKLRQTVNRIKRENPAAVIVVCGCFAQVYPDSDILKLSDIIVGEANKTKIPDLVQKYLCDGKRIKDVHAHEKGEKIERMNLEERAGKTRAVMKIQDGCNMFCSYCIIPYARGRSRSKPLDEIEKEAAGLVSSGHKELVLVGINLSCYGFDLEPKVSIADAVERVCRTSGADRVRLGSIEPELLSEDIIKRLSENKALCPHFHLSLQSGCDKTLKCMKRRYTSKEYSDIVNLLRKYFPTCAVTTDVMVGFPGETDADFSESLEFVKSIGFAKVHVFPYSARKGTLAADMPNQVDNAVKLERADIMSSAAKSSEQNYLKSLIGTRQSVLFEREKDEDWHQGHTRCYTLVKVKRTRETLWRQIKDVKITEACDDYCTGKIIE